MKFLPALLLILAPCLLPAQRVHYIFQAGATASNVRGSGTQSIPSIEQFNRQHRPLPGGHWNVAIVKPVSCRFSVAVEPGLVLNRYYFDSQAAVGEDYRASLFYAQLPLLAQYRPINGLEFVMGPEFGYLIRAWGKIENSTEAFDLTEFLINERFKVGAMAGLQVYLAPRVALAARASYSLTPLYAVTFTDETGVPVADRGARLLHGQLSLRYQL